MVSRIYKWFLYYAGAALTDEELEELKGGGDRITYWFRRSKKRLGIIWWVGLAFGLSSGLTFLFWFTLHILGVW